MKRLTMTKRSWIRLGATLLGGFAGFMYYLKIGCTTGSCPLTSDPYFPTLWGALFGWFLLGPDPKTKGKEDGKGKNNEPLGI